MKEEVIVFDHKLLRQTCLATPRSIRRHCCQLIHHGCTSIYATFRIDFRKFFFPRFTLLSISLRKHCVDFYVITILLHIEMCLWEFRLWFCCSMGCWRARQAFFFLLSISTHYSLLYLHKSISSTRNSDLMNAPRYLTHLHSAVDARGWWMGRRRLMNESKIASVRIVIFPQFALNFDTQWACLSRQIESNVDLIDVEMAGMWPSRSISYNALGRD